MDKSSQGRNVDKSEYTFVNQPMFWMKLAQMVDTSIITLSHHQLLSSQQILSYHPEKGWKIYISSLLLLFYIFEYFFYIYVGIVMLSFNVSVYWDGIEEI